MLNITQGESRVYLQNIQNRYIKLELLSYQFQTLDSIEGVCTSGSLSIDANADIRRTGSLVLAVNNSSFEIEPGGKIWLDKYVKVFVGTQNLLTSNIEWTNCGIYIIDAPKYKYDVKTNTLTLSLLDLMAKLTGARNGYLPGLPVVLTAGENIREAIIDTLALGGFNQYVVEEAPSPGTIPNDLEFSQGATIYDLLSALRDIYPNYEIFFDVNGVFYYKPIPTGDNEPVMVDDSLWKYIVIDENVEPDFQNVKNIVEVYGRTHEPAYFATNTSVSGKTITLTNSTVTSYTQGLIYGFTLTNNPGYTGYNLRINSLTSYPLRLLDGTTPASIPAESGTVYYCVQFQGTYWNYLGHLQAYGYAENDNPDSPFYVNGTIGEIRLAPLYGGDYENIYTDDLATQRAEYELYLHSNMNDTITLTCVTVPWLDVNILVEYTTQRNNVTSQYLIKSISYGLAAKENMTVKMMKYYPTSS